MSYWLHRDWYLAPVCVGDRSTVSAGYDTHQTATVGGSLVRWPGSALQRVSLVPDEMPDAWERLTYAVIPGRDRADAQCAAILRIGGPPTLLAPVVEQGERITVAVVPDEDPTGRGAAFDPDLDDAWALMVPAEGRAIVAAPRGTAVPASWVAQTVQELAAAEPAAFPDAVSLGA